MKKTTKEKGITLIALIITIIVMLILVGVTVSVALNGGLFSTAKDAAIGTNKERIKEEITSVVLGFANENLLADVNIGQLKQELSEVKGIVSVEGNDLPITVKDESDNEWIIDQDGTIKSPESQVEKIETDAKYFEFELDEENKTAILTGIAEEFAVKSGKWNDTVGIKDGNTYIADVILPSKVLKNGTLYTVMEIGEYAFYGCSMLTSATIPEGVVTIGPGAFRDCSQIAEITIPSTVDNMGGWAFPWNSDQTIHVKGKIEPPAYIDDYSGPGWSRVWAGNAPFNANILWEN